MLGQIIMCFSAIKRAFPGEDSLGDQILTPEIVTNFLFAFVDQKMRLDKMPVSVG